MIFLQAPKDVFVCSVLIYVQRIRGFTTMRYINLRFTYLLTYLTQYGQGRGYLHTKWHLDPSSRLATIRGPKLRGVLCVHRSDARTPGMSSSRALSSLTLHARPMAPNAHYIILGATSPMHGRRVLSRRTHAVRPQAHPRAFHGGYNGIHAPRIAKHCTSEGHDSKCHKFQT